MRIRTTRFVLSSSKILYQEVDVPLATYCILSLSMNHSACVLRFTEISHFVDRSAFRRDLGIITDILKWSNGCSYHHNICFFKAARYFNVGRHKICSYASRASYCRQINFIFSSHLY